MDWELIDRSAMNFIAKLANWIPVMLGWMSNGRLCTLTATLVRETADGRLLEGGIGRCISIDCMFAASRARKDGRSYDPPTTACIT